jgi:hypothetical protein
MGVYENISVGKYDNAVPYTIFEKDVLKKSELRAAYKAEQSRLNDEFYKDCCGDLGLNPEKKSSETLFQYAYDDTHGSGLYDVYLKMSELHELMIQIAELEEQGN